MSNIDELFADAYVDLDRFIKDRADLARFLVVQPMTFDIWGGNTHYCEGWKVGFRRCLAELKRMADKDLASIQALSKEKKNMDFRGEVNAQTDKRKIGNLVDEGAITAEDLANAPIIQLKQQCKCLETEPNSDHRCIKCLTKYKEKRVG